MPDIVTFDPVSLLIIEIANGTDNEIDAIEIYSEWKAWLTSDPSRLGFPQAFVVDGGRSLPGGKTNAPYFFLQNGWRFRPAELDHRVRIVGNMFTESGAPINVPTLGNFNVVVELEVSPQALQLGSGLTTTEQAQLRDLHKRFGLDPSDKFKHTPTEQRTESGDIIIKLDGDGKNLTTVERQP